MGGIATELLPGDVELARRAAGGDGAAFVRLYDHYSADVFEASLRATGEVEAASDATQTAFLNLLRRPPAMGAPESEVAERLHALALGAVVEAAPMTRRTERGAYAPAGAGVGWLRNETVAKAGARFDDDWSVHLAHEPAPQKPPRERVAKERPLVVSAAPPALAVEALPPLDREPAQAAAPGWPRLRRLALPSPAAAGALLLLAIFAGATGLILAGAGGDPGDAEPAIAKAAPAQSERKAQQPQRADRTAARKPIRRAKGRPGPALGLGAAERAFGERTGSTRTVSAVRQRPSAGGRLPAVRRNSSSGGPQKVTPNRRRGPTAITAPAPQEPQTTPAAPDEPAASEPAQPAPPPKEKNSDDDGSGRSCNSKNADC
jgi:hypothetical protein